MATAYMIEHYKQEWSSKLPDEITNVIGVVKNKSLAIQAVVRYVEDYMSIKEITRVNWEKDTCVVDDEDYFKITKIDVSSDIESFLKNCKLIEVKNA